VDEMPQEWANNDVFLSLLGGKKQKKKKKMAQFVLLVLFFFPATLALKDLSHLCLVKLGVGHGARDFFG